MKYDLPQVRYMYDRSGFAEPGVVSPMIVESWDRSRKLPMELKNPSLSNAELAERCKANKEILSVCSSLGEILYSVFLHKLLICTTDADMYLLSQIRVEKFMNQIGSCGAEDVVGTTAISLAMRHNKPVKTRFQENYALRYQHCCLAFTPIHDLDRKPIATFGFVSYFGRELPNNVLSILGVSAKIIETVLHKGEEEVARQKLFSLLLEQIHSGIIILNDSGKILGISNIAQDIFAGKKRPETGDYVTSETLSSIKTATEKEKYQFDAHLTINNVMHNCTLIEKIKIKDQNHYVLTFDERLRTSDSSGDKSFSIPIIGESWQWMHIKDTIRKICAVNATKVLIEGETGTGKTQVAKAIHSASGRTGKLITINCGALPKELLQSELFGYSGGAFTGAKQGGNKGKIEMANGGTLFLDEIGEMPLDMQVSLLSVIEERRLERLGSSQSIDVDVNIIAATNKNLQDEVEKGRFREDLYYRLSVVRINIPPLRERRTDIPLLTNYFLSSISERLKTTAKEISSEALEVLYNYSFPGNVRELQNILEYALVFFDGDIITADFIKQILRKDAQVVSLSETSYKTLTSMSNINRDQHVLSIFEKNGGNISKTAIELGVSRNTIYKILRQNNLR